MYKKNKSKNTSWQICQGGNVEVDPIEEEVDEIKISIFTKEDQIRNISKVVVPCIVISATFLTVARYQRIMPSDLFTGLLTLIFSMKDRLGFHSTLWYSTCLVSMVISFITSDEFTITVAEIVILVSYVLIFAVALFRLKRVMILKTRGSDELRLRNCRKETSSQNTGFNFLELFELQ